MEKKTLTTGAADTRESRPDASKPTAASAEKAAGTAAGFFCYIGPGITGLIQHGAIYRGTRETALAAAAAAIEKYPLIKTLIVPGDKLPEARLKVKKPGNALYQNYQRILRKG
jgi:hypothetical protein